MSLENGTQHIIQVKQHYEVVDEYGKFLCSGDTIRECKDELLGMIQAEYMSGAQQSA